tara:strand:+ start:816 stop:1241 length:426 start_codon:yes stop_codon:yes gene_type:complete
MVRAFVFILVLFCVVSCDEKSYDLKLNEIQTISFNNLPNDVASFIIDNIDSISIAKSDLYYTTDLNTEFTYGRGGVAKNWFGSINSNYHHFFIEGVHFRLKGNRGHPFILENGILYFCELNMNKEDFLKKKYYKIEVPVFR